MKPYYVTELGKLYHCTAQYLLEQLTKNGVTVNLALFYPPFWMSTPEGKLNGYIGSEDSSDEYIHNLLDIINKISHVLTDDGVMALITGDTWKDYSWSVIPYRIASEIYHRGYKIITTIVWAKEVYNFNTGRSIGWCSRRGMPNVRNIRLRPTKDHIIVFTNNKRWYINKPKDYGEVWCASDNKKPEGFGLEILSEHLLEALIKTFCPPDGIVLDPFIGSGTTAVVCEKLGYRWIGSEMIEKYAKIAKNRIERFRKSSLFARR